MQDKQTTAFILIVLIAFIFWAYNKKTKTGTILGDIANTVTGKQVTTAVNTDGGTPGTATENNTTSGNSVSTFDWMKWLFGTPTGYTVKPGEASIYTVDYNAVGMGNGQFPVGTTNAVPIYASNGTNQPFPIGYNGTRGDI